MYSDTENYQAGRPSLSAGETILWSGKPKKWAFIVQKSLALMPIAVIWLVIDLRAIRDILQGDREGLVMLAFFALHLMPVWLWLGNVVTSFRQWKNASYYVTNRRVIIRRGCWTMNEVSLYPRDIANVQVRSGFLDNLFHTGDVLLDNGVVYHGRGGRGTARPYMLEDLENPQEAYRKIQEIIMNIPV